MKKDLVRIYFNKKEDLPKCWSIDFGEETTEIITGDLQIHTARLGLSKTDFTKTYPNPCAWFEYKNVVVHIYDDFISIEDY